MIVLNVILVIIAAALWAFLLANLFTLDKNDPVGRGFAAVWAVGNAILLWIVLAAVLVIAAKHGDQPGPMWAILLLHPASGVAVVAAVSMLADRRGGRWPMLVPMIAPGMMLALPLIGWPAAGVIAFLAMLPWPLLAKENAVSRVRRAEADAAWKLQEAREKEEKLAAKRAKFETLNESTPLWVWQEYADVNDPLRPATLAKIRQSPNRQPEAEAMLEKGFSFIMREMPNLGLQPTPALLAAGKQYVANHAIVSRPPAPDPGSYDIAGQRIEYPLAGIGWLVEHGCDLREELVALIDAVKQWGDSRCRGELLGLLEIHLATTRAAHDKA